MKRALVWLGFVAACGQPAQRPAPVIANPQPEAPPEIVVGHYASMTGANAVFGQATDHGIQLAVDERNAHGGVNGATLRLVTYDDAGKPSETSTVVTRLIVEEGATALLGEVTSSLTLVGAPIAQEHGVPMITPSATNPEVTSVGDMVFRACMMDDFQAYAGAQFARDTLGATTAAVFVDQTTAYSVGLADSFAKAFADAGGTIVLEESYQGGAPDAAALARAMKGTAVDVVYLPGYYSDAGAIIQQLRKAGITTPILGGDGWDSPELPAIDDIYYTTHFSPLDDRPDVKAFVTAYRERFGADPDSLSALGYDAAALLFDAMARSGTRDGADVRDALAATEDFHGVTGTISFDAHHDAVKSAVVIGYAKGAPSVVAHIDPP